MRSATLTPADRRSAHSFYCQAIFKTEFRTKRQRIRRARGLITYPRKKEERKTSQDLLLLCFIDNDIAECGLAAQYCKGALPRSPGRLNRSTWKLTLHRPTGARAGVQPRSAKDQSPPSCISVLTSRAHRAFSTYLLRMYRARSSAASARPPFVPPRWAKK